MKENKPNINLLLRKNIRSLVPYSSAREEYQGENAVFLDANENPFNAPYNRYPDPYQHKLKQRISDLKKVKPDQIFLGNGSDEAIDLIIRAFCEPGIDNMIGIKPTYGMYRVCADINNVEYREAMLKPDYQLNKTSLLGLADKNSKLMFLCSPNNPTSNSFLRDDLVFLIRNFNGLVVLDEAYIDFSKTPSMAVELDRFPNLIILQTLSKAWGMAGIRLGMAFASEEIITVLNHIKYPYNVNVLTQRMALKQLDSNGNKDTWIRTILKQRSWLERELSQLPGIIKILPSDANFLMVKFERPSEVYGFLVSRKIIVRDRSRVDLCEGFLRITIGTMQENTQLLNSLKEFFLLEANNKTNPRLS
jgi:histidinol-phosphate aminotransferase